MPDFISWHSYSNNVRGFVDQAAVAREFLDKRGMTKTETCINEWHFILGGWEGIQSSASSLQRQRAIAGPCGMHGIDSARSPAYIHPLSSNERETPKFIQLYVII